MTKYIVNPKVNVLRGGLVNYTVIRNGEEILEPFFTAEGETVDSYLANNPEYILMGESEYAEYERKQAEEFITEPKAITEERYWDMLEVLPPCRWTKHGLVESFHLSERTIGNIALWCCKYHDQYCEFQDVTSSDKQHITEKAMAFFDKQ